MIREQFASIRQMANTKKTLTVGFALLLLLTFCMIPILLLITPYSQEDIVVMNSIKAFALMIFTTVVGIFVLWVFLRRELQNKTDLTLLGAGVFYLCYAVQCSVSFPFSHFYKEDFPHIEVILQSITCAAFFLFLGFHFKKGQDIIFLVSGGILISLVLENFIFYDQMGSPSQFFALAGFALVLLCCYLNWDSSNRFLTCFAPLLILWIGIFVVATMITSLNQTIYAELQTGRINLLFTYLSSIYVLSAGVAQTVDLIHSEIRRDQVLARIEEQLTLAETSYEHLKNEHAKIMILHNNMNKYFQYLRTVPHDPNTIANLDDLISETVGMRPIFSCGNDNLDLIFNAKLRQTPKVIFEIVRSTAPETLPLSEREISSVFMNILDNAIEALSLYEGDNRRLTLDLSINNDFFVFMCENSAIPKENNPPKSGRGLGLLIIHGIINRHNGTICTSQTDQLFSLRLAIPLTPIPTRRKVSFANLYELYGEDEI